ncbi:MAG: DUF6498-containing protein [Caulobacter sp.]|nr:DUF6498-containing protein [Caulobacter sp.]
MTGRFADLRRMAAGLRRWRTVWTVLANLVPVVCVLLFGWKAAVLLILYWSENLIIGAAYAVRIFSSGMAWGRGGQMLSLFLVPFFVVHYGMFCFVHGIFVMLITTIGGGTMLMPAMSIPELYARVETLTRTEAGFALSLLTIAALHAGDLVGWLMRGGPARTNPMNLMFEPYGRIVVLHLGIMGGTVVIIILGQPIWALLVLAIMKTLVELGRFGRIAASPETLQQTESALKELNEKLGGR